MDKGDLLLEKRILRQRQVPEIRRERNEPPDARVVQDPLVLPPGQPELNRPHTNHCER